MKRANFKRRPFRRKKPKNLPKLSRDDVNQAVSEYLKSGGKITVIENEKNKDRPEGYPSESLSEADDFLLNR